LKKKILKKFVVISNWEKLEWSLNKTYLLFSDYLCQMLRPDPVLHLLPLQ